GGRERLVQSQGRNQTPLLVSGAIQILGVLQEQPTNPLEDLLLLALPTFEWVKNNVHTYTMGARIPEESAIFRALDGVEFESSAVKEDGRLQMLPIAETIRVFLIV
ncbi:MAG TPA: hypothetical protein VJY33_04890, partial [Isosphaeraceae bacterium]|nr:hypothetical protein [Isosphaeraceae bacterium]